jgi:hypothetical protein
MTDGRWQSAAFGLKPLLLIVIDYCDKQIFVFSANGHRPSAIE